ncbi:MAG TPA: hypothetical protein P5569_03870 [Candidatus Latescibacteria bacterium]|nr:hypothetical protein [Candidatus Latescibacterota bacterium]
MNSVNPSHFSLRQEISRKLIHLMGLVLPLGYSQVGRSRGLPLLALATVMVVTADALRLYWPFAGRVYRRIFGGLTRSGENSRMTGASYMMVGQALTAALFPVPVAIVAMTFGAVGDSAAAIGGRLSGKHLWLRGKSIEGSLACLIACFVAGTAWAELPLACVWTGAVVATLAEALPLRVNDNAIIPVSSGAAMAGLMFLFM